MTNIYCTYFTLTAKDGQKSYSCQEQLVRRLVVIHHANIQRLAFLSLIKLNLEYQNMKKGRKHKKIFFYFHEIIFEISITQSDTTVVSIAAVSFNKATIIITIVAPKNYTCR